MQGKAKAASYPVLYTHNKSVYTCFFKGQILENGLITQIQPVIDTLIKNCEWMNRQI